MRLSTEENFEINESHRQPWSLQPILSKKMENLEQFFRNGARDKQKFKNPRDSRQRIVPLSGEKNSTLESNFSKEYEN